MSKANHILSGVGWSAFERLTVQGLQFAVFVFMARVLNPEDYGLVGMLAFFIVISQLVAEGGLSQAIIRTVSPTERDCATAFWVNVAAGLVLYGMLYAAAPLVAGFYREAALTDILRVLGLCVIIQSTLVVHRALLTAKLDFKTQAKSTLVGALVSGMVGLYMAYSGYGVWSIVGLQLANQIATGTTLWIVSPWRPAFRFCPVAFRVLFSFGSKLLVSNILESLYQSIYTLTIGKMFSAYAVGCYTNARQLGSISSENLTRIVQRAAYPMFCGLRGTPARLRQVLLDYLRLSVFFIAPMMLGLAAMAEPLTTALIGGQWLYTAQILRILCLLFLFFPLTAINMMIPEILGLGAVYLRLQAFGVVIGLLSLVALIPFGLSEVCCGLALSAGITYCACAIVAGREINLGLWTQLRAILPILLNAAIMAVVIYLLIIIIQGGVWLQIFLSALIGILVYAGLSVAFQTTTINLIGRLLRRRSYTD